MEGEECGRGSIWRIVECCTNGGGGCFLKEELQSCPVSSFICESHPSSNFLVLMRCHTAYGVS